MFDFIRRSLNLSGDNRGTIKKGMFFVFVKDFSLLMTFVAVYLGFSSLETMDSGKLWIIFAILFASFLFNFISNWLQNKYIAGVFFTIYKDYRLEIGERLKKSPMGYFNEQSLSKILSCFTNVLKNLENLSQMTLNFTISGISISFFVLLGMFGMNLKMGLLALVLVTLSWAWMSILFRKMKELIPQEHEATAAFSDALVDGIRGVSVLRSFPNVGDATVQEIHSGVYDTAEALRMKQQEGELIFTIYSKIYGTVLNASSLIMTMYACVLYTRGEVQLPQALTLSVASFLLFGGLKQLENSAVLLVKSPAQLDYLGEVLDIPEIKDGTVNSMSSRDIQFDKVSFGYGKGEVLHDLSFAIKEGSKTAIVGPSGSGKSTIINLIARFYDVDSGAITIGGTNIKDYEVDALLKELSLVFQDVYLFSDTIKNNIRFAKPSASDEEIELAAKRAMCHDFITAMPDGYDTLVGEGGSSLSGGEKQRISIARALLKNASIVLLDEATSSVDPENEYEIMTAIEELTKGKTVISIAHRLSTVRHADQVLVIEDGNLVQQGVHDDLMKEEGVYRNFIRARERATSWSL